MSRYFVLLGYFLLPVVAFAQTGSGGGGGGIFGLIDTADNVLRLLVPIAVTLALLLFIWGLALYIGKSGDEEAKEEGKRRMMWGGIALFVIVSIWGIVEFLQETLDINPDAEVHVPQFPSNGQN